MKTATFSVLLCMLSLVLLGCCQRLRRPSLEPRSPTGLCEVVGAKYEFIFEKEPEIVSLQPLIRKNRIVLLLGDSKAHTVAFLIRLVRLGSQAEPLRNVETFTLSYPERVLKLEESPWEEGYIKFRGKKYTAFISYDLQEWLPLSESPLTSGELEKDLALMEKSWETAFRLEYVRDCQDYSVASQKMLKAASTNCFVDNELCDLIWAWAYEDLFSDGDGWFSQPPTGGGMGTDWGSYSDIGMTGEIDPDCKKRPGKPDCPAEQWIVDGVGADSRKSMAKKMAKSDAEQACGNTIKIWGTPKICNTGVLLPWWEVEIKGCCQLGLEPIPTSPTP